MKKFLLSALSFLFFSLLFLIGLVYYSPHFFIKHLLKDSVMDLRDSGLLISLVEPEPRKTALHLSIPSIGIKDLMLEPRLVISHLFPPTLDVVIEKRTTAFSVLNTDFEEFFVKILARQLLSKSLEVGVTLSGRTKRETPVSFEFLAQSKELSPKVISFLGTADITYGTSHIKGPIDFTWDLKKDLPDFSIDGFTRIFDRTGTAKIKFEAKPMGAHVGVEASRLSHPSLPKHLAFNLSALAIIPKQRAIQLSGSVSEMLLPLKASLLGTCEPSMVNCTVNFELPVLFSKEFSLDRIFPDLKKNVTGWEGKAQINAGWKKSGDRLELETKVSVNDLSGFIAGTPFINFKSSLEMVLFPKIRTKKQASIKIEKIGENLSVEDAEGRFSIRPNSLQIHGLGGKFKGGTLSLMPTTLSLSTFDGLYVLTMSKIDLGLFLNSLKSERLSGEGILDGTIPMQLKGSTLFVNDAHISNRGPGRIKYLDASISDVKEKIEYLSDFNDLLARGQQALAYKALSDFHYSVLELRANRSSTEKLSVALHLKGKNPNLAKGQPFEINLPISGNLESFVIESLIKSSMESDE